MMKNIYHKIKIKMGKAYLSFPEHAGYIRDHFDKYDDMLSSIMITIGGEMMKFGKNKK